MEWHVRGPQRFACMCEAERAAEPPPLQPVQLCGRQALFQDGLCVDENLLNEVEDGTPESADGDDGQSQDVCQGVGGWRR